MLKKVLLFVTLLALVLSTTAVTSLAADDDPYLGKVVKLADSDTLYYISSDGKRYVYPNENVYNSWFTDFSDVVTISADDLANYPLVGNILYRPGVVLIKIQTDPKVYAVSQGGILRWIKTEQLARHLYGDDWNTLIDDLASSFFSNYSVGDEIDDDNDYDADEEVNDTDTTERNNGLALGHLSKEKRASTVRCRAVPAQRARPHEGKKTATPAISARTCKLNLINDDDEDDDDDAVVDETAPVISNILVTAATSTATISWTTDEQATSKVEYATSSLAMASTTYTSMNADLVTSHSLTLETLTPSTTYYFIIKSADAASNIASTTQSLFETATSAQ